MGFMFGYLHKQSADYSPVEKVLLFGGPAAVSIGASMYAGHRVNKALDNTPGIRGSTVQKLLAAARLPKDYPVAPAPGLNNAMYTKDPGDAPYDDPDDQKAFQSDMVKHGGGILYDPTHAKAGIIGHEIGHALQDRAGGWSKFNQGTLRPLGGIFSLACLVGASRAPSMGLRAAALGGAALGAVPTLTSELTATTHAGELMDKLPMTQAKRQQNHDVLNKAYNTYLIGGLAFPATALAGLAYMKWKESNG
jgi:hypothetical protein